MAEGIAANQVAQDQAKADPTPNAPGTGNPPPAPPAAPAPPAPAPPPPPGLITGPNAANGFLGTLSAFADGNSWMKARVIQGHASTLNNIGTVPTLSTPRVGVGRQEHAIIPKLPPGYAAGSTGAGPCIGVIIRYPRGGAVCVYHFGPGDNPVTTMNMTKPSAYPDGTFAMVFGGDNSPPSNALLGRVVAYLKNNAVDYGYSDSTGANIDSNGQFFLYLNDSIKP